MRIPLLREATPACLLCAAGLEAFICVLDLMRGSMVALLDSIQSRCRCQAVQGCKCLAMNFHRWTESLLVSMIFIWVESACLGGWDLVLLDGSIVRERLLGNIGVLIGKVN